MAVFESYPFQRRVADLLSSGQNVILQAPTGAGKTYAALLPFIEARQHKLDFPHRCIYSTPMRVLANQFAASELGREQGAKIQTGEHADDPDFRNDLIFATIDQVLSSFLMMPYSLSRRQANLNAGAIASSYLVFDEFHLFDPKTMLPTTLEMLRILRSITPFLLMTATFSRDMLAALADYLHAVVVPETPEAAMEMQELPSQQKTRRYHVADRPLDVTAILGAHKARSLVICNTVERAQRLYLQLRAHSACREEVILLHSRYLPADRARIEERLRAMFGKDAPPDARCIAVATQAIEVGLDITCETLHTELAPANSILQRAGRCARYRGETGDVYVYRSVQPESEVYDLIDHCAPYVSQRGEITATLNELMARNGEPYSFLDEQDLITIVHGTHDRDTVIGLKATQSERRLTMNACWNDGKSGAADLIRSVASQRVIIHDDPASVAVRPFAYESFQLHIGVVAGLVKRWMEELQTTEIDSSGLWGLQEITPDDEERTLWGSLPLQTPQDAKGVLAVIVHPALARYDAVLGFWPYEGGQYVAQALLGQQQMHSAYTYHLEPYEEHARLVWQAHRAVWPSLGWAADRLERRAAWPKGTISHLAELTALLHDVGKLNVPWQKWVRQYQRSIERPVLGGYYAHTDSDPNDPTQSAAARAAGKRPAHAVEGAIATIPLMERFVAGDLHLLKACFTAIARHHGAFTSSFGSYELAKGSRDLIRETLVHREPTDLANKDWLCTKGDAIALRKEVDGLFLDPDHDDELVAYMLLARALRLADQEGTGAHE